MFDSYMRFQARLRPHAQAIVTPERWATYAELEADTDRVAAGLRARGVTPEVGVVSIQVVNDEYLRHVVFLALATLGVASSPSNDPAPDVRLTNGEGPDEAGVLRLGRAWLAQTLGAARPEIDPTRGSIEGVGRVMLSSGTTSTPRRIAQSWRMIDSNVRSAALTYCAGKAGRWVVLTRLDAMLGQALALTAWATGATIVTGFTPTALAEQLPALQPEVIGCAPPQLREMLAALPATHAVLPNLRLLLVGAALSPSVAIEARLRLASDLANAYGATECGCAIVGDLAMLEVDPALVGAPVPGVEVQIVDAQGSPLPAGQVGELLIRSDRTATSYIGDPEGSARAFRHGGFLPGDLARLTPDGQVVLEGRKDERLTIGLYKFTPALMEDVALDCPGVKDAAAFAAPDRDGVDRCWLAVVTGDGFDRDRLADRLAQGGVFPPVRFAFTQAIPRGPMGKVERERLKRETLAVLGLPPD